MKRIFYGLFVLWALNLHVSVAWKFGATFRMTRKTLQKKAASAVTSIALLSSLSTLNPCIPQAYAADLSTTSVVTQAPESLEDVYFGVGCFWHVMHEFVQTERRMLGRDDMDITSRAGYAGGKDSKLVCYHNMQGAPEYGSLGYGEVVGMQIPQSAIGDFATEYFSLFGSDGDRPDKGDRGLEYRSLLGLPGGMNSPLFPEVEKAALAKGLKLVPGNGGDADTLGKKMVWVMDTKDFPFRQAEIYHQFHDGFMPGERYGGDYNNLASKLFKAKKLSVTGCPDSIPRN